MTRGRRIAVAGVLVLAVVTLLVAVLSTWVKRQALDTDNWTNTSSRILESKNVQATLGAYLVDQLFTNVDVAGTLRSELPTQFQGLAGPAAGGLRQVADRAAPQLLARPRVQNAWRLANENAHKQFLRILNGGGPVVSTANGEVVLDLHALVTQLAGNIGIGDRVSGALPADAGRLVIMRANQLKTAQNVAKGVRHLSIVSAIVSFFLFGLAIFLARGRRRHTLRTTGWCFFGVGVFCLLVRRMGGDWIVDGLVRAESVKPAAHDTWNIGTGLLRAIALAFVIYGLVIVAAAWLAGPSRSAQAVRRALAPSLRDHPWRVYAGVGFVYLLVLLWGPTPALRHIVPILIIAALLVLGVEVLRRQTAREFPDAQAGDTIHRLRAWYDARRGRPAPEGNGHVKELERLASLHDSGALTDEEYTTEKTLLLSS
jgi:Short C-terminal domain